MKAKPRHFLDLTSFTAAELRALLEHSKTLKASHAAGRAGKPLEGKQIALVFEKPSTRTRVSFEAGINQLGGHSILMDSKGSQLGRGETVADTARVLSRYVDAIMLRCYSHNTLLEMAKHATVPVINGLTDSSHPCQIMADILTYEEHKGPVEKAKVAWIGDCNNVANSWIQAAGLFGFTLHIASPAELAPRGKEAKNIIICNNPLEAAKDADLVTTDTWVSMGDDDADEKRRVLQGFQVHEEVMKAAKKDALFMHCLPAHRGEEVTAGVIDGKHSVVWDEAENRMHIQKSILLWALNIA